MQLRKVIISGGGTGGHIFPAIAVADSIRENHPDVEILFVGAIGKMEMEKVPAAGYKIVGLPITGLSRKISLKLFTFPFKVISSLMKAKRIVRNFNPDVALGTGGYASYPTLRAATSLRIPAVVQEQNSFAGIANKRLGSKVSKVCVAYEGMEKFFPKEKVVLTGNPVREEMIKIEGKRDEAMKTFGLDPEKKTVFALGGSLGARTINESIKAAADQFKEKGIQVIWQCGKYYEEDSIAFGNGRDWIHPTAFIKRMDLCYAAADIIVSRAGAISVSEICLVGKPTILIPSPNVAEDHQTKNAMALAGKDAAIMIKDAKAIEELGDAVVSLVENESRMNELSSSIKKMGISGSADAIREVMEDVASE